MAEFYKDRHKKDGLTSECKPCRTIIQRAYLHDYYLEHREKLLAEHRITATRSYYKKLIREMKEAK